MRISIDIDGVLSRFTDQVVQKVNKIWPGKLPEGYVPQNWDYTDVLAKKDWDKVWQEIKATEDFWEYSSTYENNVRALSEFLLEGGKDVFFITSRTTTKGKSVQSQTYNWMAKNRLPIADRKNYSAIVPVAKPNLKRQVMEGLDIKMSVDDYGPTVEMCNEIPGHKAFVLDQPWNRDKYYGPRVYSLAEFLEKTQ